MLEYREEWMSTLWHLVVCTGRWLQVLEIGYGRRFVRGKFDIENWLIEGL
jgi:hypothetical protein